MNAGIVYALSTLLSVSVVAVSPISRAAEAAGQPQTTSGASEAKPDPFGDGDPFAVIEHAPPIRQTGGDMTEGTSTRPKGQAAVYAKEFFIGVNDASRINPANRIEALENNYGVLETRMTLSDRIDEAQKWRWLFRGFASTYSTRDAEKELLSRARIDELFVDWKSREWFASMGKRRINWGHAQGFNPVNVVAPPRDPLNPSYETEGRPLLWFSRNDRLTVDMVITRNYDRNWSSDQNRWGIKWSYAGASSDYALYYFDGTDYTDGHSYDRMLGASFSADVLPGVTLYMEMADFSRNRRNYYAADGLVSSKDGSYFQGVAGTSTDLGNRSSVFIEYFYNGQGYAEQERQDYFQFADMRLASVDDKALIRDFIPLSMNRDYLLLNYRKEYREKYAFNLSMLLAKDRSSSTRMEGVYMLSDYYEFRISYVRNAGDRESEFGNSPYSGLLEMGFNANF